MARHFYKLNINAFRGIKNLQIENLGDVNIFVGNNNCGKTSVLEAIQLACDPVEYTIFKMCTLRMKYQKSYENDNFANSFINIMSRTLDETGTQSYNLDVSLYTEEKEHRRIGPHDNNKADKYISIAGKPIKTLNKGHETDAFEATITSHKESGNNRIISTQKQFQDETYQYSLNTRAYDYVPDINVRAVYTADHIMESDFANIINSRTQMEKAVNLLKSFDEDIVALRYVSKNGVPVPVVDAMNYEAMPLFNYGDGMKKVLTIADAIISCNNGILLIDEFEATIHTSAMSEVFSFIIKSCKEMNVQLFLTTHSIEAVDKLLSCDSAILEDIRVITLRKKNDKSTLSRVLNGKEAKNDRDTYEMELRV